MKEFYFPYIKDMKIAIDSAVNMQIPVPGMKLSKQLYEGLSEARGGNEGRQALYIYYQMMTTVS